MQCRAPLRCADFPHLVLVLLFSVRIWPFQNFNAIQSTLFETAAKSDKNVVVSAPTGCGKVRLGDRPNGDRPVVAGRLKVGRHQHPLA